MVDPLKEKQVLINVNGKSFDQTHVPAYRVIEASKKWNIFMGGHAGEMGGITATEQEITDFTLELAIYLLKRNLDDSFSRWWKGLFITKKKLLKSLSFDELNQFVEKALEPVLGSKKKALSAQKKIYDLTSKMLEGMPQADLARLLQKLPSLLAGLKEKS